MFTKLLHPKTGSAALAKEPSSDDAVFECCEFVFPYRNHDYDYACCIYAKCIFLKRQTKKTLSKIEKELVLFVVNFIPNLSVTRSCKDQGIGILNYKSIVLSHKQIHERIVA